MTNSSKNSLLLSAGLLIGGVAGYLLGKRNGAIYVTETEIANILAEKMPETLEEAAANMAPREPVTQKENIFKREIPDDWDEELERNNRVIDAPYVITKEEFIEDQFGFQQETYTYYVRDDVLANEGEERIFNWQRLTGELKFGHGSGDPDVVYIRNEAFKQEYEILRHSGYYQVEVEGVSPEDIND